MHLNPPSPCKLQGPLTVPRDPSTGPVWQGQQPGLPCPAAAWTLEAQLRNGDPRKGARSPTVRRQNGSQSECGGPCGPAPRGPPPPRCQWQNQCRWQLSVCPSTMSWGERSGDEGDAPPHPPRTYHGARSPSKTHRAGWPPQRQLQEETGWAENWLVYRSQQVRRAGRKEPLEGEVGWSPEAPPPPAGPLGANHKWNRGGPGGPGGWALPSPGRVLRASQPVTLGAACSAASLLGRARISHLSSLPE